MATSLSSWARTIRRTIDAAGCDGECLMREAGMDPRVLEDPHGRYPLEQTTRLWRLAVDATGDPCLGLRVASGVTHTTFHALSYSLLASATLKEAFGRIARYFRIASDAADTHFEAHGDEYHVLIRMRPGGPQPAPEAIDAFLSVYVRMCRSVLGRDYAPRRIEMRRSRPAGGECFERILRAPIVFGAPENRLVFDRESFERRLDSANPELARHNDAIVVRHLARIDRDHIGARVEAAFIERLPQGEPSQEDIAQQLAMSPRSLQRRLADEGCSYKALLDRTRRELALSYLRDARHSVCEITYLLGFSDTSSFTRAFRRWTGRTPTAWRTAQPESSA
ncbi:AraC family transcriptional regulator [Sinimarinibacterium flocculans]|uniref:AraC family transcriptional regulator n=1 Tax=Sinimarinibacterium flocculans TaxID=985250 RepID=A0A318E323_9GAMM|nr:AraC family transcriptional regulator [Sinimarinibacterium flocculans]PXV65297.1 AraC family transcriptional regulator [Sinimarinibacterium flocculans]